MKKLVLSIAAGALAITIFGPTSAAQAGCYTKHHPSDPSWITVCDRERIAVCDNQGDGHYTWARYRRLYDTDWASTARDNYGRDSRGQFCYHERVAAPQIWIVRVCVSYEGCGPWKDAGAPRLKREPKRLGWFRLG